MVDLSKCDFQLRSFKITNNPLLIHFILQSVSGVEVPERVKEIVTGLKSSGLFLYAVFHLKVS